MAEKLSEKWDWDVVDHRQLMKMGMARKLRDGRIYVYLQQMPIAFDGCMLLKPLAKKTSKRNGK